MAGAGGHVWQGVMCGRVCGGVQGVCMAGETATAADSTHPLKCILVFTYIFIKIAQVFGVRILVNL